MRGDSQAGPRTIVVKRVYDEPAPEDGDRVLVDGLWPRGVRRDELHLDAWARQLAPSRQLRSWYGHAPERFAEFRERYLAELEEQATSREAHEQLTCSPGGRLTLLTATRNVERSHAAVLAEWLARPDSAGGQR